jgi:Gram-negative bacterial TonB protein C-terminal
MKLFRFQFRLRLRSGVCLALAGLLLSYGLAIHAQQAVPARSAQDSAARETQPAAAQGGTANSAQSDNASGDITEEELQRMLVGKPLFLRGGFLADSLEFNEHGNLIGDSTRGSYTLCAVQIDKVRMSRRKVQLVGARYGLHFLGALAYEDPAKGVDRVKITPKKKMLKITIDRELVVKPKKVKKKKKASDEVATEPAAVGGVADGVQAGIAATAPEAPPTDPNSPTTTTSPAHSAMVLRGALDRIFADSIDARMIASMPDFWKLYYQAAAAKTDYKPTDKSVMHQDEVDQKAKLLSKFEPASNEFAQTYGVAGMSLYHAVIGADGKPGEIAVARPIGFGLDENAVAAIRNAKFEPAISDGKPVPVLLDLVVQFRIYSKRTSVESRPGANNNPAEPTLPGPYTVQSQEQQKR